MFRAIACKDFEPFENFEMEFPPVENRPPELAEVQLLTGVNGTGKTRILSVLAALLGHPVWLTKRIKSVQGQFVINVSGTQLGLGMSRTWDSRLSVFSQGQTVWNINGQSAQWATTVPAFAYNGLAYVADAQISVLSGVPNRLPLARHA